MPSPRGFSLPGVVTSHGWHTLAPYYWSAETGGLHRIQDLHSGTVAAVTVQQDGDRLRVTSDQALSPEDERFLRSALEWSLRLSEDLSALEALFIDSPERLTAFLPSGGRLLRSPTLWEDVVKTILTTNTTWTQTKAMTSRFVSMLGRAHPTKPAEHAFPTPEAVALAGTSFLKEHVRLGYRAGSVFRIAEAIENGRLPLEELKSSNLPTPELRKLLLTLPGVGPYAAATLLMILGRYDELPVDTELRAHVSRKYFSGVTPTEREMQAIYEPWGRWRYLAYWFDPPEE